MGRTTTYNEEDAEIICHCLSEGITLAQVCRELGMARNTVYNWQMANPAFAERIARARDVGFDAIADDAMSIADDKRGDPQRDKLRIETRLKLLAKWSPKRYGDMMKLGDPNGEKLTVEIVRFGDK